MPDTMVLPRLQRAEKASPAPAVSTSKPAIRNRRPFTVDLEQQLRGETVNVVSLGRVLGRVARQLTKHNVHRAGLEVLPKNFKTVQSIMADGQKYLGGIRFSVVVKNPEELKRHHEEDKRRARADYAQLSPKGRQRADAGFRSLSNDSE